MSDSLPLPGLAAEADSDGLASAEGAALRVPGEGLTCAVGSPEEELGLRLGKFGRGGGVVEAVGVRFAVGDFSGEAGELVGEGELGEGELPLPGTWVERRGRDATPPGARLGVGRLNEPGMVIDGGELGRFCWDGWLPVGKLGVADGRTGIGEGGANVGEEDRGGGTTGFESGDGSVDGAGGTWEMDGVGSAGLGV